MNIKLWYIKSKNRMKFAHILWAIWSNLYQKLEKKFLGTNKSLLKNWITDTKNKTSDFIPMKAWNKYCNELGLKHYGSDPWYMGWDVISCPERIVVRKVVDCDDYSILAHSYFGDYINTGDSVFDFKGIFTMTWEDGSAHAISVWKNKYERNSYLVVSNDEMIKTRNISSLFKKKDIKMLWVANLSVVNGKIKFLKIDDNFWI